MRIVNPTFAELGPHPPHRNRERQHHLQNLARLTNTSSTPES